MLTPRPHGVVPDRIRSSWPTKAVILLALLAFACGDGPTAPMTTSSLTGRWVGLLGDFNGPVCAGDWAFVVLNLDQQGSVLSGQIRTLDDQTFAVTGSIDHDAGTMSVAIPDKCSSFSLPIDTVGKDHSSRPVQLLGVAEGTCCAPVHLHYRLDLCSEYSDCPTIVQLRGAR